METEKNTTARELRKFHELAREAAEHHFGSRPKRIAHRSGGLTNFVFSFENDEGKFIIRISPDPTKMASFLKEQWAERAAKAAGVPVAEILEVGLERIGFPYMISRSVPGSEATHHPKRFEILQEMGRAAAAINSIKTKGFGETFDWSDNKLSHNAAFTDYLHDEFDFKRKLSSLKKNNAVSESRAKALARIFADAAKQKIRPVLNHGDLRLKNVIVSEDGKINAIIDWEGCISNTPAWDLSIALHDLGIDGTQHFLEGYGISERKLRDALPLIKAFNIANYASALEGMAAEGSRERLAQYRLRLSGALDLYSI